MPRIKHFKGGRQLPDGRWLIRYPDREGRYHEKTFDWHEASDEEEAKGKLRDLRKKVEAGERPWEPPPPPPEPEKVLTFGEWASMWWETYSRPALRSFIKDKSRLQGLRRYFGEKSICEIGYTDVILFRKTLKDEGYADWTINSFLSLFRRVMNKAKKERKIDSVPDVEMIPPEQPGRAKILSEEEEALLMFYAPHWLAPLIRFSLHTGLRLGEMVRLERNDVNLGKRYIQVVKSKNRRPRQVELDDSACAVLAEALKVHRLGSSRVFQQSDGYVTHAFTKLVRKMDEIVKENRAKGLERFRLGDAASVGLSKVDMQGVVWHTLRHTRTSRLLMAGVDPQTVVQLLGWSSLKMLNIYAHTTSEHRLEALRKAEKAFDGSKIWREFGVEEVAAEGVSVSG